MECTGWEWLPRGSSCIPPSEVDIEMVGNREEDEHERTTHETDIMTDAIWIGIGKGPMMMRTMRAAARWNRLDDYR
jgi:hypothetical protein